jgi:hypothetical protein
LFSTTTGAFGNDNNTIDYCDVHNVSGGNPIVAINSTGTTTTTNQYNDANTVSNSNVYDYFHATNVTTGILIGAGNSTWSITNNRFYQTAARTITGTGFNKDVYLNSLTGTTAGSGYVITGNYFGGSNSAGTGTYTLTGTTAHQYASIYCAVGIGTATSVQNNTINNISFTSGSTSAAAMSAITTNGGNVNIGTVTGNTIGIANTDASVSPGITYINNNTSTGGFIPIFAQVTNNAALSTTTISNNLIAGIAFSSTTATNVAEFNGIGYNNGTVSITNNTIGSTTTAKSIYCSTSLASTTTSSARFNGILLSGSAVSSIGITVTGNTIANMYSNLALNASPGTAGLKGIHATGTIEGVDFSKLSQAQKGRTIRSFLFYKEKYFPDGKFDKLKARLVASGDAQDRSLYTESQTSSPTVSTETLFMVAAIAGREKRKVVTVDIGSAFLRGKFREDSEPIIMRLDKEMADALCKIDPNAYKAFKRHDGSMYVQLKKPLYGLIEAAKLWFEEISRTLKSLGFKQNVYDECCWNRDFKGKQQTIVIHVDDILATCELEEANQQLIDALKRTYEQIGTSVGLVHSYLGMTFDFSIEGRVRVTQEGYVTELVASEDLKRAVKTPATSDLFEVDVDSPRLSKSDSEDFHSNTAKLLFLSKRTRPDICVPVSFLTSRVQESTEQDMGKLKRVLRYLLGTKHMGITLEADSQIIRLRCFVDASYGVHRDCKSHTGTVISLGSGPVLVKSVKQKINTKSSTEAELVGLSDSMSTIIWCRNFLEAQGYDMPPAQVFQDNMSTIAMIRSGKPTSDRTRHINIRFFFINDREKSGEVKVEYRSTKSMHADILTKPLQGEQFEVLRNELLNIK